MKKLFIIASIILLSACSKPDAARSALAASGYTNIVTTGYAFFGCDEKDAFHTGFEAKGANGQQVTGVVCAGWFKGSTIRVD